MNLRPRTRELYEGLLRLHVLPALGDIELRRLAPAGHPLLARVTGS